ncbi:MAG: ATP-binding protein, partial [Oleiphilaceae bacterium]|nr:ATP-binding protein [Oleiphilaceae bacterium]
IEPNAATVDLASDGTVQVFVFTKGKQVVVEISNDGPLLPTENPVELFSPMLSTRSTGSSIHLGLGLHIAKLICDHHNAQLTGRNRDDQKGVVFTVAFTLI